METHKPLDCHQ